jgi:hypothetical protein
VNTLIIREEEIKYLIDRSTETKLISQETSLQLNSLNTINLLKSYEQDSTLVYSGIPGPVGPAGPAGGEDEVAQEKRTDFITNNELYRGEAIPGTLDSAAAWRIRKITIASDNDVRETWANGDASYDKIWDNRLSYTYST